ncbi:MAG: hypothetical protein COZ08_10625, partial [Bacteroidetes bacterium CG_4_10_14_3_um_filter_42_6]
MACDTKHNKNRAVSDVKNEDYQLVWHDEFDYDGLPDSAKWKYDTEGNEVGWGNLEAQEYTMAKKENAGVENGILRITALYQDSNE